MLHILFVHMHIIGHWFFGEMRKLRTIGRTNRVDRTQIGLAVEELTRRTFIHPLTLPVLKQPFFLELPDGHVQMFGYPLQVFKRVGRRHVAAAIRTAKAINFLPYFLINDIGKKIEVLRWIVFNLGKKAS